MTRADKREDLKRRLVEAAEVRIAQSGLAALRARDLAEDAGCALGAIYNAFADMDHLVLAVNARTLRRLGAMAGQGGAADARARLKELAQTYAAFATDNKNLWAAVFEHRMAADRPAPEWYLQENAVLIEQIVRPLAGLQPGLAPRELLVRARTLFSAVHGIVTISLESRFVGIPQADLRAELDRFVDLLATGLAAVAAR